MQEILERLVRFKHIETFIFDEDVILNQPVENWPICDCLISFHSKGFPLEKAAQYVELRKPFVINDLKAQYALQDRLANTGFGMIGQMMENCDIFDLLHFQFLRNKAISVMF